MYRNPDGYDLYMGRWSARLAPPFLDFCGIDKPGRYLDLGCGTGSRVQDPAPEARAAVRAEVGRRLLGDRPDGPFTLIARAFAVRGRVPPV